MPLTEESSLRRQGRPAGTRQCCLLFTPFTRRIQSLPKGQTPLFSKLIDCCKRLFPAAPCICGVPRLVIHKMPKLFAFSTSGDETTDIRSFWLYASFLSLRRSGSMQFQWFVPSSPSTQKPQRRIGFELCALRRSWTRSSSAPSMNQMLSASARPKALGRFSIVSTNNDDISCCLCFSHRTFGSGVPESPIPSLSQAL